ncbi:hypothetical protein UPYG_G00182260 [Umbra pygmaea]|uniref:Uncharacterized protein n=1 Tax=Umbra pygmaea TaxID=75934 RepID=A0ABD0X7M4_UMBPY
MSTCAGIFMGLSIERKLLLDEHQSSFPASHQALSLLLCHQRGDVWRVTAQSTHLLAQLSPTQLHPPATPAMEDYDVSSAASILASVKEQEARFERLTRALEEERRHVSLQLDRSNATTNRLAGTGPNANLPPNSQPLAWQQVVMQVNNTRLCTHPPACSNHS